MNPSTVLGMVGGVALLVAAVALSTADIRVFLNLPGLVLVLGGTLAATLMSYPLKEVARVFKVIFIVLRNERLYERSDIDELVRVARLWYGGQIREIEKVLRNVRSPFLRTGLQLVVDGTPIEDIVELLRWRIARLRARERTEAQMFRSMAAFAPAFGMVGTLLGLVNMLQSIGGGGFEQIGMHLALALITTFYGIILANLLFKPIAIKFEHRTEQRVAVLNMALEGVVMISRHRSPTYIRETLRSFMARHEDEVAGAPSADPAPARGGEREREG